jgi:hypothetical protein
MNIQRWIGRRQPTWQALDVLLKKLETRGVKALSAEEIRQFASLYRSVSGDLARAKTNQVGALVGQNNLAAPFWAFVFPHGSLELPAIFLAGGAGFLLARALLFPGQYRRSDALKLYGTQAAQLAFGLVPMLVLAGIIEGFFSPQPNIPDLVKYVTGILLFVSLVWYLGRK